MERYYDSLSVAITALQKEGYVEDFNVYFEKWAAGRPTPDLKVEDMDVIQYYRFEGMTNPSDNSILYVIEVPNGMKGLLVDSYGGKTSNLPEELLRKLKMS
ncbi:MAG TPA: phosphoribosylpyrophosphate synthetase [Flavobacteriaceae bacterium]|nr:phosphoribosylpyrophosphate synthetase [Flavobacteriaceae bacterium]MCB9212540.1 phosphoribosylpyrophosphate synthetase [Alteromonas sp.]HPF10606.1 phosphoribosylpyrophosphate synthetase [Flavobacteriaceae bacterium]HQU20888.1 phosphoribosylpyrophosphate synthetase [Flavobacteriaceae bacterium]HQU64372.1 phosphoribosylpyrophosphate synthetase [Flavobacteriaceae bacterium]